ncbi:stem-specific protein TSJT1-like [Juglans microcarpa x Juglans regia]|uniref:stem-specific protein TSJT1-like n=1 Tax=Juglans microcarpa x Juglans regia TaxID=2249226 RepID=UPI001B7E77DA|nr:stem-specific protein TSJT1-like [Juglans microcarpa x Juglans regia]
MLSIFNKGLVQPPQELNSPAPLNSSVKPAKLSPEILKDFVSQSGNAFSISFENATSFAYVPPEKPYSIHQRLFCAMDEIYCIFLGSLNNLCSLIKQYGLSKGTNEAMFVMEAYKTLRDRGPYPADQVLKDLDGSFGFVIYDNKAKTVFAALGANEEIRLFWGISADGSVVISDKLEVIKASCAKSFAPFPTGCMFHSEHGLMSFEHPRMKIKAMPRIDSEGVMCGADFKVDVQSRIHSMPRVGSEANWAIWGSHNSDEIFRTG